jgi:hypothetical protein
VNRTARALVSLYALLCLLAGVCVPALHAADVGSSRWTTGVDAPQPHDRQHCLIC